MIEFKLLKGAVLQPWVHNVDCIVVRKSCRKSLCTSSWQDHWEKLTLFLWCVNRDEQKNDNSVFMCME